MKLQLPFIQLPLQFDASALAAEVDALGESVWRPHPQGFPGNSALPLVAANGNPEDDAVQGPMRPTPHLAKLPYMRQVLGELGAVFGRSRLMRLSGEAEVSMHVDVDYYWREHVRVHVPITTQPDVRFYCADQSLHMAAGECWIFDTWQKHRVVNSATRARIHLVADTVGGDGFWSLVSGGRVPASSPPGWTARSVPFAPGAPEPALRFESVNVPAVMTPWELQEHLGFILSEAEPHPQLQGVQQLVSHFVRHWRSLWAWHGDSVEGVADYRAALQILRREIARLGNGVRLRNAVDLQRAVQRLIVDAAVNIDSAPQQANERSAAFT